MANTEHDVARSELRWAAVVSAFVVVTMAFTLFAALALHRNPPSNSNASTRKPCISRASSPNPTSGPESGKTAR
jgi:hypothetical protein